MWPTVKFWDSLYISGTAEATNVRFGEQIDYKEYYQKMQNYWTKGAWPRSRDLLLNFGTPHISETALTTNVKFVTLIEYKE